MLYIIHNNSVMCRLGDVARDVVDAALCVHQNFLSVFFLLVTSLSAFQLNPYLHDKRFYPLSSIVWTSRGHRCFPFFPQYMPSFLSRTGLSIRTCQLFFFPRFSQIFANPRSRFLLDNADAQEKFLRALHSGGFEPA